MQLGDWDYGSIPVLLWPKPHPGNIIRYHVALWDIGGFASCKIALAFCCGVCPHPLWRFCNPLTHALQVGKLTESVNSTCPHALAWRRGALHGVKGLKSCISCLWNALCLFCGWASRSEHFELDDRNVDDSQLWFVSHSMATGILPLVQFLSFGSVAIQIKSSASVSSCGFNFCSLP